jgi:hypothetical protein
VSEQALGSQFVMLPRSIVMSGSWRTLWLQDGEQGASVSACPVMALLGRGYGAAGAICRLNRLAALTGVPKAKLQGAKTRLHAAGLIRSLPGPRRGIWRFALGERLADIRQPAFAFPGALLDDGYWAGLRPQSRCLLVAMAATAAPWLHMDSVVEGDHYPPELVDWFSEGNWAEWERLDLGGGNPMEMHIVRRVGAFDADEMRELTGLSFHEVAEAEAELIDAEGPVSWFCDDSDGVWYHLPADWWARMAL